ncbi:MAG: cupin domain-containing protein [[Clostridium] leptum]
MNAYKTHTDDTLRETVVHGNQAYPFAYYPENIWEFDFHRIDWHWHHELEFLLVDKGMAICFAGDNRIELSEGSIFINSGTLHRYGQKAVLCPNIIRRNVACTGRHFDLRKYVNPILHSSVAFQVLQPDVAWQHHILETLNRIFLSETDVNELHTIQLLLQCWMNCIKYEYG